MDQLELDRLKKQLLDLVPPTGSAGNAAVREKFLSTNAPLTEEDYWLARNALIEEGLLGRGKGRGGSVHRVVAAEEAATAATPGVVAAGEAALYGPFHEAIRHGYVKDNDIRRYVSDETARQGRRSTGGKWTRPDITLIAIRTFLFLPKQLEVISFEIKPSIDVALEGVFEAAAHSAFAHRSYIAFPDPTPGSTEDIDDPLFDRIFDECERFGIGLILFDIPVLWDSFNFQVTARRHNPDPASVDNFISTQISAENQRELRDLLA
jgi:hypothetical protein